MAIAYLDGVRVQERHEDWAQAVENLTRKLSVVGHVVINTHHFTDRGKHMMLLSSIPVTEFATSQTNNVVMQRDTATISSNMS